MTERISLVEAYNNRDVIAQLVRLRDNVDELMNILANIDPNGDLTNVVTKTGDQTIDGVKTFIGQIVADCDIIQNGAAYETHAEQVFSVNDYIVTRDGQITAIPPGDLSGFHVKKYDGTNDSRLGVDNTGTMRVGDVGSEEPLLTRDEAANLTDGECLIWDSVGLKAVCAAKQDPAVYLSDAAGSSVTVPNNTETSVASVTATKSGVALVFMEGRFGYASSGSLYFDVKINSASMHTHNRLQLENAWNYWSYAAIVPVISGDTIAAALYQNSGSSNSSTGSIKVVIL